MTNAKLDSIGFVAPPANTKCGLGTWCVEPNLTVLHNSPAKPCPCKIPVTPTITQKDVTVGGVAGVEFTYTQSFAVNDNTYGTGAIGWGTKGHTFANLTGSDHWDINIVNNNGGATVFALGLDYISAKIGAPSGYGSLGPFGGDGACVTVPGLCSTAAGKATVLAYSSSLDVNLNDAVNVPNKAALIVNSPAPTGGTPDAPTRANWNYINSYSVTIKASALPASYTVTWPTGHNSPAKLCPT